jgi:transketolase
MKNDLEKKANWIRRQVLEIVAKTSRGHIGGTFSCTDILVALYYGDILKFDSKNPNWSDRDRFVLGKGHASLALYHILVDLGFFDISRLEEYGTDGSSLSVQLNLDTPGVEYNTGSLGHALGIGAGMALAAKMDNKDYKTFALVGDGECAEGSIWESIMFASQLKLNNLIGIIDCNKLSVTEVMEEDEANRLAEKIKACGWKCLVIDGHSFEDILTAFKDLNKLEKPLMIIANTIKGKGVSFMENNIKWHNAALTKEELDSARRELSQEF